MDIIEYLVIGIFAYGCVAGILLSTVVLIIASVIMKILKKSNKKVLTKK